MFASTMSVQEGLRNSGRVKAISSPNQAVSAAELAALVVLGCCAGALSGGVKLGLGISGHAIIQSVFPMALGMALVPRRGSGAVMGVSALSTALVCRMLLPGGFGLGATVSVFMTALTIDVAMLGAKPGRSVYFRLMAAGLVANLIAFAVKLPTEMVSPHWMRWISKAPFTYPICGLVAGAISAAVWFRFNSTNEQSAEDGAPS